MHPRSAAVHHKGRPDYDLAAELVRSLPVPVILSGGLRSAARVREAFAHTGAAAVMLARGALGNPWLFAEVLGEREEPPAADEVLAELGWVMGRAVEHLGSARAGRYLRKFYPWYVERLAAGGGLSDRAPALDPHAAKRLNQALQATSSTGDAWALLDGLGRLPAAA
jgi:tRNA-dihydrouridine synthase B